MICIYRGRREAPVEAAVCNLVGCYWPYRVVSIQVGVGIKREETDHFHKSSQALSNGFSAFQLSSVFALFGIAVKSSTSPARRGLVSYGSSLPTDLENALIMSKTVDPLPVPRFHSRHPVSGCSFKYLRAAMCPFAKSITWM